MNPNGLDWAIVLLSIVICAIPPILLAKRAGSSTAEFFTSGQSAPWWLIGVSMVATTFSTDTPNLVTNFVRTGGVASNWQWWAFLLTGMATVFFFARLWRRSGVLTDLEFYELRYSGRAATLVRGFRAVYLGLFFNCFIMASVNLAAAKIASIVLGWPMWQTLVICGVINIAFAASSGLWGVLVVDFIQFGIALADQARHADDKPADHCRRHGKGQPHAEQVQAGGAGGIAHRQRHVEDHQRRVGRDGDGADSDHAAHRQGQRGNGDRRQQQRNQRIGGPAAEEHQRTEGGDIDQQLCEQLDGRCRVRLSHAPVNQAVEQRGDADDCQQRCLRQRNFQCARHQ